MFEILSPILDAQLIAVGREIRELKRLNKAYARWRKLKGFARIRYRDGRTYTAEIHWYEAHGIGRKEAKIKRILG